MTNLQKRGQQKGCKCRNSKCMKLYCQCLSMRVPCNQLCSCIDCHNRDNNRQTLAVDRKKSKDQLLRGQKGCSCRRSNCTKKYCDCFHSGILCNEFCKCVDCQNNESMTNIKVINQLRKNNSDVSNYDNNQNLYPLYLSQNSEHLNSIITESNPLGLQQNWLEKCAKRLYEAVDNGQNNLLFIKMLQILNELDQNITEQHKKNQSKQFSEEIKQHNQNQRQQAQNYSEPYHQPIEFQGEFKQPKQKSYKGYSKLINNQQQQQIGDTKKQNQQGESQNIIQR